MTENIYEHKCAHCGAKDEYPNPVNPKEKCTNCEKLMFVVCPECHTANDYTDTSCANCRKTLGRKFDEGKTDWTLAPWPAFEAIVSIMMFGAAKYSRGNWKSVKPAHRYIAACYRHLASWCDGEPCDKETGRSHLWHAGCCIVFCIWLEIEGKLSPRDLEDDNNPKQV